MKAYELICNVKESKCINAKNRILHLLSVLILGNNQNMINPQLFLSFIYAMLKEQQYTEHLFRAKICQYFILSVLLFSKILISNTQLCLRNIFENLLPFARILFPNFNVQEQLSVLAYLYRMKFYDSSLFRFFFKTINEQFQKEGQLQIK